MPVPPTRRPPNSQIAPGQRPYNSDGPTASTHNKRPIHELTEGRRYRVRDKDWACLWAEDMSYADATALKEKLVAERRSTTARVEDMSIPPPPWWQPTATDTGTVVEYAPTIQPAIRIRVPETARALAKDIADTIAANPITSDDARDVLERWIAESIETAFTLPTSAGATEAPDTDEQVHEPDPYIDQAQAAARRAAAPLATAANQRQPQWPTPKPRVVDVPVANPVRTRQAPVPQAGRVVPRDKTVVVAPPRTAPPPRDKTVSSEIIRRATAPDAGEPTPMMSPLKAAMLPDELDLPEGSTVLGEDDLSDLLTGVGSASDEDHARAKIQAEKDRIEREREAAAKARAEAQAESDRARRTPPNGTPEVG